jgi:hypothetical protein
MSKRYDIFNAPTNNDPKWCANSDPPPPFFQIIFTDDKTELLHKVLRLTIAEPDHTSGIAIISFSV